MTVDLAGALIEDVIATRSAHHHDKFDIDERALEYGARMIVALGLDDGARS